MAQAPLVTDAQPEEPAYTAALSAMPDLAAQEQADAEDAAQRQSKQLLDGLGQYLQEDIDRRKADRLTIEMRWLADMEQYNSIYDGQTAKALEASASASKVFIPLTRRICNIVEARLGDLLFPTDDRNFVVEHSPVPELAAAKALAAKIPADQMVDTPDGPTSAGTIAASIRDTLEEAAAKAIAMQKQIDDRLQERNYAGVSRQAINQGIVYGTGVIKGPMVLGEDEGKGIPTVELERVFDKFRRMEEPSDRSKGAGLGLAIAKGFVEAMGGRIAAASPIADGHGTRILISLPKTIATHRELL